MTFVEDAQETIGYVFRCPALLDEALTHKSYLQERTSPNCNHNERLEFLGDAVLALVVSEALAAAYPTSTEGELSKAKSRMVSEATLAQAAIRLDIGKLLRLGRGEEVTQGRLKSSLLADALEAVIAAIYLDGGLEPARHFILQALAQDFSTLRTMSAPAYAQDYKSRLQEFCHKRFETLPQYVVVHESGLDHQKTFDIEVKIQGKVWGRGRGKSKKEAEQIAAKQALEQSTDS